MLSKNKPLQNYGNKFVFDYSLRIRTYRRIGFTPPTPPFHPMISNFFSSRFFFAHPAITVVLVATYVRIFNVSQCYCVTLLLNYSFVQKRIFRFFFSGFFYLTYCEPSDFPSPHIGLAVP